MVELTAFAGQYAESLAQVTGLMVCVTDRDQVVAAAGGAKKDFMQKPISRELEQAIDERQTINAGKQDRNFITIASEDPEDIAFQVIAPIICEGDAIGAVAILSREGKMKFGDNEVKMAVTAANFLGRQMEG